MAQPLLSVEDLKTYFFLRRGVLKAIDGVSFDIGKGEIVGIVGESGSGKSVTALSILRLIAFPGRTVGGQVLLEGEDLLTKPIGDMQSIRGGKIAMIFQDPLSSLNPVIKIGDQIAEAVKLHLGLDKQKAYERVYEVMEAVGIVTPEVRAKAYPFQFSGGMRQRIMIAMALSCNPQLIIADEPTTNLDVMVQAQILELIKNLTTTMGISVLLITHNLGVVAWMAQKIVVMYAGEVKETGTARDVFKRPVHPYTTMLMRCVPRPDLESERLAVIPGTVPNLIDEVPSGCRFHPRCYKAKPDCSVVDQKLREIEPGHWASCMYATPGESVSIG